MVIQQSYGIEDQMLVDTAQLLAIRQLMAQRFPMAVSLFIEYADLRIETLEIGIGQGREARSLRQTAALVKDNATAIGARGLAGIAQMVELALEETGELTQLQPLVAHLRDCFHQTRHYFKYAGY